MITPDIDQEAVCNQVFPHLETFCKHPERFAKFSLPVVQSHIVSCARCARELCEKFPLLPEDQPVE